MRRKSSLSAGMLSWLTLACMVFFSGIMSRAHAEAPFDEGRIGKMMEKKATGKHQVGLASVDIDPTWPEYIPYGKREKIDTFYGGSELCEGRGAPGRGSEHRLGGVGCDRPPHPSGRLHQARDCLGDGASLGVYHPGRDAQSFVSQSPGGSNPGLACREIGPGGEAGAWEVV